MFLRLLLFPFMDKFPSLSPTWLAELDFLPVYFSPRESCSPIWKLDSNRTLQGWKDNAQWTTTKIKWYIFLWSALICLASYWFSPSGSDTLYFPDQNVINIYNENFNRHSLVCKKTFFLFIKINREFFPLKFNGVHWILRKWEYMYFREACPKQSYLSSWILLCLGFPLLENFGFLEILAHIMKSCSAVG